MRRILLLSSCLLSTSLCAQTTPQPGTIAPINPASLGPMTINGTDFGPRAGIVIVGEKPAAVISWQANSIQVTLPAVFGTVSYVVCNDAGCSAPRFIHIQSPPPTPGSPADRDNGIVVSGVIQFSDATLQMYLDAARNKLASMQFLDQASIAARIGGIQGGTYTSSSLGISANGPSLPGVATTANTGSATTTQQIQTGQTGSSGNVVTTQSGTPSVVTTSPSSTTSGSTNNQIVATGPSVSTVTTQAPAAPAAASAPSTTTSFTLPSGFQTAASQQLSDQLELTSQITGYELLLESSLTDRFMQFPVNGTYVTAPRTRVTLGVPIDIRNAGKYPNAVAEVTLTVTSAPGAIAQEPPVITALLPTEKTYNVASVVDKTFGISGGVTTAVASIGGSFLHSHKTFYVVKEQDTLAYQVPFSPNRPMSRSFGWQFRPTLGALHLTEGPRTVFVQLGFPFDVLSLANNPQLGNVTVSTVWKKYDRKKGVVDSSPIANSESYYTLPFDVLHYDLKPTVSEVNISDNGDGTVALQMPGTFLPGTALRVGSHTYSDGNPAVLSTPDSLQVTLPNGDLLSKNIQLVDRSGSYSPVVAPISKSFLSNQKCFVIQHPVVNQISSTTTQVDLTLDTSGCQPGARVSDLKAVVGNRVFGFRDAPFTKVDNTAKTLSLTLPTDFLRANRQIVLKRPLWGSAFENEVFVDISSALTTVTQTLVLAQSAAMTQIALLGTGLGALERTDPTPASVEVKFKSNFYAIIYSPTQDLQGMKQIVLKDGSGSLLLVSVPSVADGPSIDKIAPQRVGAGTLRLTGSGFSTLQSVTWSDQNTVKSPVKIIAKDKKSVTLDATAFLKRSGVKTLTFKFPTGEPVPYTLTVVDRIQSEITNATSNP